MLIFHPDLFKTLWFLYVFGTAFQFTLDTYLLISQILSDWMLNCKPELSFSDDLPSCLPCFPHEIRCIVAGALLTAWGHERRHCSQLLSGDDWQGGIGMRIGIAVSRPQAVDSLKETNNARMSWTKPHLGLELNIINWNDWQYMLLTLYCPSEHILQARAYASFSPCFDSSTLFIRKVDGG